MLKPLKGLLLIRIKEKETKTISGLYLPQEKWPKPQNLATVLAVGPDVTQVKVNEQIVINPYAVHETEDSEVKMLDEKDVLAIWQTTEK